MILLAGACADDSPDFVDAAPTTDSPPGDERPGPVTNFTAANVPAGLSLSWTNPGDIDLAGILVVGGAGVPVTFTPTDGATYAVGTVVATGQASLVNSVTTSLADFQAIAGVDFHFSAWAYDAAGQYSLVASTDGRTDVLGAQSGIIQLFQDGHVVVTQQPLALKLSGTVVYDDATDTMNADVTVENQTGRVLFNLKGLVDTLSQGTSLNPTFPAFDGLPMLYLGPAGVVPGDAPLQTLGLTGIDGTMDPVVVTMHFVDAPMLLLSGNQDGGGKGGALTGLALVDSSGSGMGGGVPFPEQGCRRPEPRGIAVSADGRAAFTGSKSIPRVNRFSLTAVDVTQSADLTTGTGLGMVSDVALSADGTKLYAVLHDSAHFHGNAGNVNGNCDGTGGGGGKLKGSARIGNGSVSAWDLGVFGTVSFERADGVIFGGPVGVTALVELDSDTLAELRRLELSAAPSVTTLGLVGNRAIVLNNNGTQAHIVDLTSFTEVDTDAVTEGLQALALGAPHFENIAVAPDGNSFSIAVSSEVAGGYDILTYDSATLAQTRQSETATDFNRVVGLSRDDSGHVVVALGTRTKGPSGLRLVELDGTTAANVLAETNGTEAQTLAIGGGRYYLGTSAATVRVIDIATGDELDMDGDVKDGITPIQLVESPRPHGVSALTPF